MGYYFDGVIVFECYNSRKAMRAILLAERSLRADDDSDFRYDKLRWWCKTAIRQLRADLRAAAGQSWRSARVGKFVSVHCYGNYCEVEMHALTEAIARQLALAQEFPDYHRAQARLIYSGEDYDWPREYVVSYWGRWEDGPGRT